MSPLEIEHALSMEFETPHTDWGQLYIGGRVRALCFTFGRGTSARWIVELMQRFSVDATAAYWTQVVDSPRTQWLGGDAGERRIRRLLEEEWDCFIFHGIPLENLTAEQQYKLLSAVTRGAGLVLVGTDDERVLKPRNRIDPSPEFLADGPVGEAFAIRKGRGIRLPKPPEIPYRLGWEMEYDYWQERLGRAVLWAAGKEPEMRLSVQVDAEEIARDELSKHAVIVRWENAPEGRVHLEITLRGHRGLRWFRDGEIVRETAGQIGWTLPPPPLETMPLLAAKTLPVLPADRYHVDVRARTYGGTAAWATTEFLVRSERWVESVHLERGWGEVGEEIAGTVTLAGTPVENERVEVRLLDRRGRILARDELTAKDPAFRFPIPAWRPMLVRVEAAVLSGDEEVAAAHTYFRVTKRHRGRFNFLVWNVPGGTLGPYAEESLAGIGMTLQLSGGNPRLHVAAYDVAWVPYTTRIMAPHDERGIMKPVCWNDAPSVDDYVQGIVDGYRPSREHGVFVYSLGDETVTRGSCLHPSCLNAYREYLRREYGEIAALNASWGSEYRSFEDVRLLDPEDNDGAEALRRKNYPRWYDRQAFQCDNFVRFCKRFGDRYRALDPEARTGFEGAGRFRDGDDFDLIVRTNGFWSPYPGPGDEIIRSIAPRDFPRSNWMGYAKDATPLIRKYWRMITRGCDAVWWWRWDNIGRFQGLLAPHFGLFPAVRELIEETRVVREGLGTLLIRSEMLDDGIAVLYSHPSAYAHRVEGGSSYGDYEDAHAAWHSAIRGLGLQFRYVTDRMMRSGEFRSEQYSALILPQVEAIGRVDAEVIEAFVRNGGTVIADVRPGLFDGHCKPLGRGVLDDLFGVRQSGNMDAATAEVEFDGALAGRDVRMTFADARVNPAIAVADGRALGRAGETPAVIVREVGAGRAILLNFSMATFPLPEQPETPAFLRALFGAAGVEPKIALRDAEGEPVHDVEVIRWRNGEMEIVALFRESGEVGEVRVALPDARHVYDLRRHVYIGETDGFSTELTPARPNFFARTRERIAGPEIVLNRSSVARGEVVSARVRVVGPAGKHAFRIRATTPKGEPADWLDRVVIADRDGADIELPIAHNDPSGTWTIRATELFTEQTGTAVLAVR